MLAKTRSIEMKQIMTIILATLSVAFASTITINADTSDWAGYPVTNLGSVADPDGGTYTLRSTYDGTSLFFAVDRTSSERQLGDISWNDDSFFLALDLDGVSSSGASSDGYSRVNFTGDNLPELVIYFAGGSAYYESSSWNGSSWDWNGWNDGSGSGITVAYGLDYDEISLNLEYFGLAENDSVSVWAWMTRESNGWKEAGWGVPTGDTVYAGDGLTVTVPEPASLALLGLGALLKRKRS